MRNANHYMIIEHKIREADDFDGKPEEWSLFARVWCVVKPMRGEELLQAQQVHEKVTHKITTAWHPGVTNEMRVVAGSRVLSIVSAINVGERNRRLEMMCVEVT